MTIGFERTTFIVTEGGVVEVCAAVLSGGLERNATVTISSSDGTAVGMHTVYLYTHSNPVGYNQLPAGYGPQLGWPWTTHS